MSDSDDDDSTFLGFDAPQDYLVNDGTCHSCDAEVPTSDMLSCFNCDRHFHAACKNSNNEICSRSFLSAYHAAVNKDTHGCFTWRCKICITAMELDNPCFNPSRLTQLENQLKSVKHKLSGLTEVNSKLSSLESLIKQILTSPIDPSNRVTHSDMPRISSVPKTAHLSPSIQSYADTSVKLCSETPDPLNKWNDAKKVTILRNNLNNVSPDLQVLETNIISKNIKVLHTKKTLKGDVSIICASLDEAKKLRAAAESALPGHQVMNPASTNWKMINVVGFNAKHDTSLVKNSVINNNPILNFLKEQPEDEVKASFDVKVVKACNKDPSTYRALIQVSNYIRTLLKQNNDKLLVGLVNCKVYDHHPVLRCYNCQQYGHRAKGCTIPSGCSKCAENHKTTLCTKPDSLNPTCINCIKANLSDFHHSADYSLCPVFINYRNDIVKNKTKTTPPAKN